ncbi:MAG: type II secretion system protein [Candidatus Pacebacteria bacterium]|nr:type II secretion system protein [Candidatus Paceibacterota bacterium]
MNEIKSNKGFTLIEVLVVISIIGLLASVILIGLGGFRARGRDAKKVSELKTIQNGLELYYARHNAYPAHYADIANADEKLGISKVPPGYSYAVCENSQWYVLAAVLEAAAGDSLYDGSNDTADDGKVCSWNDTPDAGLSQNCTEPTYCVSP